MRPQDIFLTGIWSICSCICVDKKPDIVDQKSTHLKLRFWWQNSGYLMRPQDIFLMGSQDIFSDGFGPKNIVDQKSGHLRLCLWWWNSGTLMRPQDLFLMGSQDILSCARIQNWVFLSRPQDIWLDVNLGHLQLCLWPTKQNKIFS